MAVRLAEPGLALDRTTPGRIERKEKGRNGMYLIIQYQLWQRRFVCLRFHCPIHDPGIPQTYFFLMKSSVEWFVSEPMCGVNALPGRHPAA
jgi:hypothetical protein